MSKVLGSIITSIEGPVLGLFRGGGAGALQGLANATTAFFGGPVASAVQIAGTIASGLQKSQQPEQTETAIRNPIPPRVAGYGEQRLYMTYTLYITASDGTAVDVGAFHEGRIDSILGHYLGDKKVTLTGGGFVNGLDDGQFGDDDNNVQIGTTLGPAVNTAFAPVIAKVPDIWTTDHRGDGVVTGFALWNSVKSKNYQKIYSGGGPNAMPLSLVMRLQPVFDWRDPSQSITNPLSWKWSANACLHYAHYLLFRDGKTWSKHFAPTLAYWTAAANDCDIAVPLKGARAILTLAADPDSVHTLVLSNVNGLSPGMAIVIASLGNTSLTETRTVGSISGLTVTITSEVGNKHPAGSAVTWSSDPSHPVTESRYRSCVVHKLTDQHKSVKASLLACFDGWETPRADGALVVYSGRYCVPTVTIGSRDIITYSIQDGVEEENAVNTIPLTYVSADHDYTTVDTDPWVDEDDIEARGKELAASGIANQVPSHSQARRLGKRAYAEAMAGKRGTCTTRWTGRKILGERYIWLELDDIGLTIAVQVKAPVKRNPLTGQLSFSWILADPNVDAWNPATEEGDPAPVGNRVASEPLDTPSVISAIFFGSDNSGSGTPGARVRITATGPDRSDMTWFVRWRVAGAVTWNEQQYNDTDPGASVILETGFVPVDADVEVEVAYEIGDGRVSPYSNPPFVVPTGSISVDVTTITADTTDITADRT